MKKWIALFVLSVLFFGTGCAKKNVVVETPEGKVTAEQQGNTVTIESKEGKTMVGSVNISAKVLGVPIYPGAAQQGGMTMAGGTKKKGNYSTVVLTSKDPIDKVVTFYKQNTPSNAKFTMMPIPGGGMTMIELEKEGKDIHIQIMRDPEKQATTILVVSGDKK